MGMMTELLSQFINKMPCKKCVSVAWTKLRMGINQQLVCEIFLNFHLSLPQK